MKISIIAFLVFALNAPMLAGENPKQKANEVKKVKKIILPVMATVVSIARLYTANNQNWISVTIKDTEGYRMLSTRAIDNPLLMHVRPGDKLNLVVQENDGQDWVLGLSFVGSDGTQVDEEKSESDVIVELNKKDKRTVFVKTRRGHIYHIDKKLATFRFFDGFRIHYIDWTSRLRRGQIVTFDYIQRGKIRWATQAKVNSFKVRVLHNPHADEPIVTKIVKTRYGKGGRRINGYWYYIWTQFPRGSKKKGMPLANYEVDSRWNIDVRLQKIGDPPTWHKEKEPSPYSDTGFIGRPVRYNGPSTVVSVNNQTSVSNANDSRVSSNNRVSGVNTSTNNNSNVSRNTNDNNNQNTNNNNNQNNNDNNNQNNNDNQNTNDNNNQNNNNNDNSNSNSNENNLNNNSHHHNNNNNNNRYNNNHHIRRKR